MESFVTVQALSSKSTTANELIYSLILSITGTHFSLAHSHRFTSELSLGMIPNTLRKESFKDCQLIAQSFRIHLLYHALDFFDKPRRTSISVKKEKKSRRLVRKLW